MADSSSLGVTAANSATTTMQVGYNQLFPSTSTAVNIGTLTAFIVVCAAIPVLRRRSPDLPRTFKVPAAGLVALIGVGSAVVLIANLPAITLIRFVVWMAVGIVIYAL